MSDADEPTGAGGGPAADREPAQPPSSAEESGDTTPDENWKVDEQGEESFPASDPPG